VSQKPPLKELGAREVYAGRIVHLFERDVELPNGRAARLEVVHHPGAAAVVPLHADGSVTLVHQYRHAAGEWLYEIPAGLLEAGEAPIECARRELAEETGLSCEHIRPLLAYHNSPGFSDEVVHLFVATGLTEGETAHEHDEVMDVVRMPLADALARLERGGITDGKTVVALLAAKGGLIGEGGA
jgi:ADP-ribose pyrophosphatase